MTALIHPTPDDSPTRDEASGEESEPSYVGFSTPLGRTVEIEDAEGARPLPLDHAQRSYAWGRAGSGPRELARAILIDATGNEMLAERFCRPLTWEIVAELPTEGFRLSRSEVLAWIDRQGGPEAAAA